MATTTEIARFLDDDLGFSRVRPQAPAVGQWELVGDTFTCALDSDRRATLEPATGIRSGEYLMIRLKIKSKTHGQIHAQDFLFDDYFSGRVDARTDYPVGNNTCFKIIDHCGSGWYIAQPDLESKLAFVSAINRAVEVWV